MTFKAFGIAAVTLMLLNGCTTHIYKGGEIGKDEGLVIASTDCSYPVHSYLAYSSGSGVNFWSAEFPDVAFLCERNLAQKTVMVELPAGSYFVGAISWSSGKGSAKLPIEEKEALKFQVNANAVTYIGMLGNTSRLVKTDRPERNREYAVKVYARNDEKQDLQNIEESFPGLLKRYSYYNQIAGE